MRKSLHNVFVPRGRCVRTSVGIFGCTSYENAVLGPRIDKRADMFTLNSEDALKRDDRKRKNCQDLFDSDRNGIWRLF